MAVQVEPPRWRPRSPEPARYPGLTPEERGCEAPAPAPPNAEPPPGTPLWVAPSEPPPPAGPSGFDAAQAPPSALPPPETEGLFDVPGLLERLWLARALEGHRPPSSWSLPRVPGSAPAAKAAPAPPGSLSRSGGLPVSPAPVVPATPPSRATSDPHPLERTPEAAPPPPVASWPTSWVCPYCYLANDPRAATCRGCRSSSLHL